MRWHLAISMMQRHATSLVERRTPWFRFHIDLDFNQGDPVDLVELRRYMRVIQGVLRRFFPFSVISGEEANAPGLVSTGKAFDSGTVWPCCGSLCRFQLFRVPRHALGSSCDCIVVISGL